MLGYSLICHEVEDGFYFKNNTIYLLKNCMNIVIIPGFTGYPEEKTFENLELRLSNLGHNVIKIAWPNFPDNLEEYNFTATIEFTKTILSKLDLSDTILFGFSMGGIIATILAKEFTPKKLCLIVSPYQAGSKDDLNGKYKSWMELGYRDVTSSRFGKVRIPFSFIKDAMRYNALNSIADVHAPVLFIVIEKDDRVPNEVTKKIFNKANEPKKWVAIKGTAHKYQYQENVLELVNDELINFVRS